jgi:hypothetical protein
MNLYAIISIVQDALLNPLVDEGLKNIQDDDNGALE